MRTLRMYWRNACVCACSYAVNIIVNLFTHVYSCVFAWYAMCIQTCLRIDLQNTYVCACILVMRVFKYLSMQYTGMFVHVYTHADNVIMYDYYVLMYAMSRPRLCLCICINGIEVNFIQVHLIVL